MLQKTLETLPGLKDMYSGPEDPGFEVFYLSDAKVKFRSFAGYGTEPQTHTF